MPRIADWGELEGPLTAFGGVHSNLHALDALLAEARGTPICTGDVVAYCADAAACVARVRGADIRTIAGNCETQLADGAADCGCGFEDGTACDLLSDAWYAHAAREVDADARAWMGALPDWATFRHAGRRWLVVHGAPSAQNSFVWQSTDLAPEIALAEAEVGRIDGILSGHSGLPFVRREGRHLWVNAGAIGMPPHDGATATRFAEIDAEGDVSIHRLDYDWHGARDAMTASGLVQGYHETLRTGWWPSEDVLPQDLRRSQPSMA
ncbi:metallophosphoesterase family protein [Roseobacter sp. HKCCA0434]|uniref:metallophosphoesterase family protein n=1 Tax=Roseobacter sp. HKCCA0434 TaxID=3079297 RepID=UPI002905A434|nr:metallophosphoesterase family protein [Roseobacter sp. HKCCA0434]